MFISGDLGRLTPPQRASVAAKPLWQMRRFASLLGWNGLQLTWVSFTAEETASWRTVPESIIVVFYETTQRQFKIQINGLPGGESRRHQAMVAPFRYGLGPTGWHPFDLFDDDADLDAEVDRLRPFLDRRQFRDPTRRAALKKAHPERMLMGSKKRRRR